MSTTERHSSSGTAPTAVHHAHDLLGQLDTTLTALAALPHDDLPSPEIAGLLQGLQKQRNRLDAVSLSLTSTFDKRNAAPSLGAKDTKAFLQDKLRQTPSEAKSVANTAKALPSLPRTKEAIDKGEISVQHAARIAENAPRLDTPDAESRLLEKAKKADANAVREEARRMTAKEERERAARRAYEERRLDIHVTGESVRIQGNGPRLDGARFKNAIDALSGPRGEDDPRTPAQRRWDALIELVDHDTACGDLPDDGGDRPVVTVVTTVDELEGRADAEPGTLLGIGTIDPQAYQQLLCEADLDCVITDPEGQPLWLGRSKRYANRAQRRALKVRDGGCRWPGCDRPAAWTIAHHEPPWEDPAARTDPDKMILLCLAHHSMRHHGGWTLCLADDATVTVTSPNGRTVLTETSAQARERHMGSDPIKGGTAKQRPKPGRPDPPRQPAGDDEQRPDSEEPQLPGMASEERAIYAA